MQKKLKEVFPYILSYLVCGFLGYLAHSGSHFFHDSPIAGVFFPINESIFEHLKLLLYPFLLVSLLEILIFKRKIKEVFPYRIFGITFSILGLPIIYYILFLFFGNLHGINIFLYFFFLFCSYAISFHHEKKKEKPTKWVSYFAYATLCLLLFLFTLLTFFPPEAKLFEDPTLQTYGYLF